MDHFIDYQDLSFKAYQAVKAMIMRGEYKPGEKLPQEKLASQLGISRMPLHKAFQMLENEMLVESKPRKGMYVKNIDLLEISDAFECREAIEGMAAKKVAESITNQQIEDLFSLFAPFIDNPSGADLIHYQQADHMFHETIIKLCNNSVLQRMEMLANILVHTYRQGLIRSPEETLPEHFAIIEAFKIRDGDQAEKLIRHHFTASRSVILKQLNNPLNYKNEISMIKLTTHYQ